MSMQVIHIERNKDFAKHRMRDAATGRLHFKQRQRLVYNAQSDDNRNQLLQPPHVTSHKGPRTPQIEGGTVSYSYTNATQGQAGVACRSTNTCHEICDEGV